MACLNWYKYANELYVAGSGGAEWLSSSSIGNKRQIFIIGQAIPSTTEKELQKIKYVRATELLNCRKIGIKKLWKNNTFIKERIIRINTMKKAQFAKHLQQTKWWDIGS